jgi:multidrug efflux pump
VLPLILGSGAGSEMRRAMGIAVFSGMLGVTLFGIFLTPVFYALLRQGTAQRRARAEALRAAIDASAHPPSVADNPAPPTREGQP